MTRARGRTNAERCTQLLSIVRPARSMLILLQDCPDPDALAAGAALREIANQISGITCALAHGGVVGRAENQALAKYLGLNLHSRKDILPENFDVVAMVDAQPGTGNVLCPDDFVPDIVIDHHPVRPRTRRSPFIDIRRRYGATSTILYEYLSLLDLVPDKRLATALLYGIRSDTQDLGREASRADIRAHLELYPLANQRMLARIQRAPVPREYYRALSMALHTTMLAGQGVFCRMGSPAQPEMVAEMADFLLRFEECSWVFCLGVFDQAMHLSLRRKPDGELEAGEAMRTLVQGFGTGGGHGSMAGGQVPLAGTDADKIIATLIHRFSRLIGCRDDAWEPLVPSPNKS